MHQLKNFIEEQIEKLESEIRAVFSDENDYFSENDLFDVIRQTIAVFSDEIPQLEEKVRFQNGSAMSDAKTIISCLKLYIIKNFPEDETTTIKNDIINESLLLRASKIFADTDKGLSGSNILKLLSDYAMQYNISLKYNDIPPKMRKDTVMFENLKCFNSNQKFKIIKDLCELDKFSGKEEVENLKLSLIKNYGHLSIEKLSNTELIIKTKHWLEDYPNALKQYTSALNKFENNIYERNTLDDMRLSFELLTKSLFKNSKSLENQISIIGELLKEKSVSVELRNMFQQVIKYYTDFQNNHIKHDEKINEDEIEYIIEITSVIMKFLIKISSKN